VHVNLSMLAVRAAATPGKSNAGRKSTVEITLSKGAESHTWTFHLAGGSFTENGLTGRGHVSSGPQIKPYGKIAVTFSALSAKHFVVCDNQNEKINHRLQVHGTLKLKTHSSWGTYSGKLALRHGLLEAGHGQDVEAACTRIPCQPGVSWTVGQALTSINGITTKTGGAVTATRLTKLAKPRHASRLDAVTASTPKPTLTSGDLPTLSVDPSGSAVTGTAELRATAGQTGYQQDCVSGQMVGSQWVARFVQGTPALTFHEHVFGAITVSSRSNQQLRSVHVMQ
jgi:hypothetical protein